jgi:hypothetical protein
MRKLFSFAIMGLLASFAFAQSPRPAVRIVFEVADESQAPNEVQSKKFPRGAETRAADPRDFEDVVEKFVVEKIGDPVEATSPAQWELRVATATIVSLPYTKTSKIKRGAEVVAPFVYYLPYPESRGGQVAVGGVQQGVLVIASLPDETVRAATTFCDLVLIDRISGRRIKAPRGVVFQEINANAEGLDLQTLALHQRKAFEQASQMLAQGLQQQPPRQ